jgi:ribosomal protein L29
MTNKETRDLRHMGIESLKAERENIKFLLMTANDKFANSKVPQAKRGNLKRRIAKINTLLKEKGAE